MFMMLRIQVGVVLLLVLLLVRGTRGDMYLHNPRGSNNRLDEAKRERNNGNRLFDSQNNNRGGYNVGSLAYMTGSILQIEWTNQHSCADPNANCEIILQYMCGDLVRDGSTTSTIPDSPSNCENYDCNQDIQYGMQENFDYYLNCKQRKRQENLFTADQKLNGDSARFTRQNPGGTRRGYECPEERDYYPYWAPTPWKDIAILTNDATRCPYYQAESANVKVRYQCRVPEQMIRENMNSRKAVIPITKEECEALLYPEDPADGEVQATGVWEEVAPFGLATPVCRENHWSRDNHLGNGVYGQTLSYNWTIPEIEHERCVLRIRYNISTGEYDGWDGAINADLNAKRNEESTLDVYSRFDLTPEEATDRGYVFENNPQVNVFGDVPNDKNFNLQLAINTAQFGRTFQDRSHTFAIRKRPADVPNSAVIHNLNVRGKRGNIVQVYPGVEYDFVPNTIETIPGEYIHVQWTGSNSNPNNNDGQGRQGTDRSNLVALKGQIYPEGTGAYYEPYSKTGQYGRSYPENLDDTTFLGFSRATLEDMAVLSSHQFRGEMSELDDAGTFYDAKPLRVTQTGHVHYMCTRNNNFSNRSQKGRIVCTDTAVSYSSIGWSGGQAKTENGVMNFPQGTLDHLEDIKIEEWSPEVGSEAIKASGGEENLPGSFYESNFIVVTPVEKFTAADKKFEMRIRIKQMSGDMVGVYRSNPATLVNWVKVDASVENDEVVFAADQGGAYVTRGESNNGAIIGIVIAAVVLVVIIAGSVVYFRKNPDKWMSITTTCHNRV